MKARNLAHRERTAPESGASEEFSFTTTFVGHAPYQAPDTCLHKQGYSGKWGTKNASFLEKGLPIVFFTKLSEYTSAIPSENLASKDKSHCFSYSGGS